MNEDEVYRVLDEIFKDVFFRDDIVLSPQLTAQDVDGWDSFKQIEIIIGVEQRFGIKLRSREVDNLQSVGGLATLILSKLG